MNMKLFGFAFVGAASLAIAGAAFAGENRLPFGTGNCAPSGTDVNICRGTLAGVRAQTGDPTSYVQFSTDNNSMVFIMAFGGAIYSCVAPESMRNT
jgi:hypothetical protein